MRALLIALSVLGVAVIAAAPGHAQADSPPPPRPSSLAPHHTGGRSYGAPIQPRILNHVYRQPRKATGSGSHH
jgi:hypothetical protein